MKKEKTHAWMPIWVDWLLILLVVGTGVLGFRYIRVRQRAALPTVEIFYTVRLSNVEGGLAEENGGWESLIPVGTEVRSANGTAKLGTVVALEVIPSLSPTVRDGEIAFLEVPNQYEVYITVRGRGVQKEGDGIRIADIRIATGCRGDWRFGSFLGTSGRVVSVKKER